jgi:hypothetical protein
MAHRQAVAYLFKFDIMTDTPIFRNGRLLLDPLAQTLPWRPSIRDNAEIIIADSMLGAVICAMAYIGFRALLFFS